MEKTNYPMIDWPIRNAKYADTLPIGSVTAGLTGTPYTLGPDGWVTPGYEDAPFTSAQLGYPRKILSVPANTLNTVIDHAKAAAAIAFAVAGWSDDDDDEVLRRLNEAGYDIVKLAA